MRQLLVINHKKDCKAVCSLQVHASIAGKFQALRLCALSALELANFGLRRKVGRY
jgi:hypothetical protein